jgi:membrane protein required for colicin V production
LLDRSSAAATNALSVCSSKYAAGSDRTAGKLSERFATVNWVDLILLCVFALFGLRGFFRGFFREFFSLIGLFAGFMIAVAYDQEIAAFISKHWKMSPLLLKGISFVAVFFFVYFLLNLAGWLLHRSERLLFLRTLNRTGGIALGMGKGAALTAMAVFLLSSTALLPQPTRENVESSYLARPLGKLGQGLIDFGKKKVFSGEDFEPNSSAGAARL